MLKKSVLISVLRTRSDRVLSSYLWTNLFLYPILLQWYISRWHWEEVKIVGDKTGQNNLDLVKTLILAGWTVAHRL